MKTKDEIVEPDFRSIGPSFLVPFEAQRIRKARVAWINKRWFLESGINIYDAGVLSENKTFILENFGVLAGSSDDSILDPEAKITLFADRYGGSLGRLQGGSGRCGSVGRFNAKGVGPSPLVSPRANWSYSHGYMWLSEAIREAVLSEVMGPEFPHGAVPVIAIIDTGFSIYDHSNDRYERCGILVRPNALRPAHLERSVFFGSAGHIGSDQYIDVDRTKRVFRTLLDVNNRGNDVIEGLDILAAIISSISSQIGAGRAHRLWHGRFLTDNISVNGALLDFGSCRSLSCWRRADDGAGQVFGADGPFIERAIASLLFYFRKYGAVSDEASIYKKLVDLSFCEIKASFSDACLRGLGLHFVADSEKSEIMQMIEEYYLLQQREAISLIRPTRTWALKPWLYDIFKSGRLSSIDSNRSVFFDLDIAFHQALISISERNDVNIRNVKLNAERWLKPRRHLFYGFFALHVRHFLRNLDFDPILESNSIGQYIDSVVSVSRRNWFDVPDQFCVAAQLLRECTEVLRVLNLSDGGEYIYIRAPCYSEWAYILGSRVRISELPYLFDCSNAYATLLIPIAATKGRDLLIINVDGQEIEVPPFAQKYLN